MLQRATLMGEGSVLYARLALPPAEKSEGASERARWEAFERWLELSLQHIEDDDGTVISFGHDHLSCFFTDTGAGLSSAVALQEFAFGTRSRELPVLDSRIGMSRGQIEMPKWQVKPGSRARSVTGLLGPPAQRAGDLSQVAASGAILLDTNVLDDLSLRWVGSEVGHARGWQGADYLGPVREARVSVHAAPLTFHEFLWSGDNLMDPSPEPAPEKGQRARGWLNRWNGSQNATIDSEEGEIFSTSTKFMIGSERIEPKQRVFFLTLPPTKGGLRRAAAVLAIDSVVEGDIVNVFPDRRYAFVRTTDGHGQTQDVFLHADDNDWPLEAGDRVVFRVGENPRGAAAKDARVLETAEWE